MGRRRRLRTALKKRRPKLPQQQKQLFLKQHQQRDQPLQEQLHLPERQPHPERRQQLQVKQKLPMITSQQSPDQQHPQQGQQMSERLQDLQQLLNPWNENPCHLNQSLPSGNQLFPALMSQKLRLNQPKKNYPPSVLPLQPYPRHQGLRVYLDKPLVQVQHQVADLGQGQLQLSLAQRLLLVHQLQVELLERM